MHPIAYTDLHPAALARLQAALSEIYYNATLPTLCDLEDVQGGAELAALMNAGARRNTYSTPAQEWQNGVFYSWLGFQVEAACEELAEVANAGKVYQWGRGGRTLAPDGWINTHGGDSFSIKSASQLAEAYDGREAQAAEYLQELAARVEAFNELQERLRKFLSEAWRDELEYHVGEKLHELQQEQRQAYAAAKAAALFKYAYEAALEGEREAALHAAAHCYAFAANHERKPAWVAVREQNCPDFYVSVPDATA